jgi:hypothetical protein
MKKLTYVIASVLAVAAVSQGHSAPNPERNVYFGDLHLHTVYSFDAYIFMGTRNTPDLAYKFARGEAIEYLGHQVQRAWPLDFLAVTDHSENIGVFNTLEDANSAFSKTDFGKKLRSHDPQGFWDFVALFSSGKSLPDVDVRPIVESTWKKEMEAANANYQPGKFTTFIGYEWSSMPDGKYNLHRNVIFRGNRAPLPYSSIDSRRPEDLWSYLESNRTQGIEALAIPHNADASGGLMYDWNDSDGKPIDQRYAERRALNEPLSEISQNKGQSETVPELSPEDEFANFEVFEHLLVSRDRTKIDGNYVRQAYGRGLVVESKVGVNPFTFGVVGATDFHNGLSTAGEDSFDGALGIDPSKDYPNQDAAKAKFKRVPASAGERGYDQLDNGSGNITGVWAEENTRDSIYNALRRKETYATSGTRIKLRFFGSWEYPPDLVKPSNWVKTAYAKGVAMGGDLPARTAQANAPQFVVWAVKDPAAANLDRVQIIKVWLKGGNYKEKVFNVALSNGRKVDKSGKAPPVGNTVDLKTATYKNDIGATELSAVWEDPTFDPNTPAVYYVRALEIPTPRWSTILAVRNGLPLPDATPAVIQERAWSSPIWYRPARK